MAAQITEGYTGAKMTVPMPPNFPQKQWEQHLKQTRSPCAEDCVHPECVHERQVSEPPREAEPST